MTTMTLTEGSAEIGTLATVVVPILRSRYDTYRLQSIGHRFVAARHHCQQKNITGQYDGKRAQKSSDYFACSKVVNLKGTM